jgi:hypothetical protein
MAIKPVSFRAITERSVPAGLEADSANALATFTGESGPFGEIMKSWESGAQGRFYILKKATVMGQTCFV